LKIRLSVGVSIKSALRNTGNISLTTNFLLQVNLNGTELGATHFTENPDITSENGDYVYKSVTIAPDPDAKALRVYLDGKNYFKDISVTKSPWTYGAEGKSDTNTSSFETYDDAGDVSDVFSVDMGGYSIDELMKDPPTVIDKEGQVSTFTYDRNSRGHIVKSIEKKASGDIITRYYNGGLLYKQEKAAFKDKPLFDKPREYAFFISVYKALLGKITANCYEVFVSDPSWVRKDMRLVKKI